MGGMTGASLLDEPHRIAARCMASERAGPLGVEGSRAHENASTQRDGLVSALMPGCA